MHMTTFGPPPDDLSTLRVTEALWPVGNYKDRNGYDPKFMGETLPLPSPSKDRWEGDVVELLAEALEEGSDPTELRYRNFSVRMSKSRRAPFVSAVNIDGQLSNRDVNRTDVWRRDPRISNQYQNLREAYGNQNQGFFSRGHMTRREDPNWGKDIKLIEQADADTFHVTNIAPQRQGFNAGIWLALEDYVLGSTDKQNMRVCVLTGPVMRDDDPIYYNMPVPIEFWKIVAFVNGNSGQLTTIGYKRSQATFLPRPAKAAFVFGDFQDTQVSVASIAAGSGLNLDEYIAYDVFEGAGENFEVEVTSVADFYLTR